MTTIGRARENDIIVDERWDTVSNEHAHIEKRGDVLIFTDHSSNGTVINGQKIHNTSVEIYPGATIMLAGVYELNWDTINRLFPNQRRPTVSRNVRGEYFESDGRKTVRMNEPMASSDQSQFGSGRMTERYNNRVVEGQHKSSSDSDKSRAAANNYGVQNNHSQADMDEAIGKWNWGGFGCTWIFAVCHKTYWPLFLFVTGAIPYLGQVCWLAVCVYLGFNGSKIAWNSGVYKDFDKYLKAQKKWAIAGIILFLISVVGQIYSIYYSLMIL